MTQDAGPLWKRLAWMAAIWAVSVSTLGVVAMVLRAWVRGYRAFSLAGNADGHEGNTARDEVRLDRRPPGFNKA